MSSGETPPPPTGLRAHIHHLLPRHALFQVRIIIHQLASVPLVGGEFGVRWKFSKTKKMGKNVHRGAGKAEAFDPEHDNDGDSFGSADTSIEEPQFDEETQAITAARGQTPWLPLHEHAVSWEQPLSAVVQMSIDRDTHRLLPRPFKLTVLQRVIANDPDAPQNPQLGVVELDLAEYADSVPATGVSKGLVTRRFLLSHSKTNALLRLSIRVEPVGTPSLFVAPPLPKGEILAGVSTLISTHEDVYRTRPHALNLYAPVESHLLLPSDSKESRLFDVRALPRAYGPRPTEFLIDALFNPAPVHEERLVSPFTRLVHDTGSVSSFPSFGSTSLSTSTSISSRLGTSSSLSVAADTSLEGFPNESSNSDSQFHSWWKRKRAKSVSVAVN